MTFMRPKVNEKVMEYISEKPFQRNRCWKIQKEEERDPLSEIKD